MLSPHPPYTYLSASRRKVCIDREYERKQLSLLTILVLLVHAINIKNCSVYRMVMALFQDVAGVIYFSVTLAILMIPWGNNYGSFNRSLHFGLFLLWILVMSKFIILAAAMRQRILQLYLPTQQDQ